MDKPKEEGVMRQFCHYQGAQLIQLHLRKLGTLSWINSLFQYTWTLADILVSYRPWILVRSVGTETLSCSGSLYGQRSCLARLQPTNQWNAFNLTKQPWPTNQGQPAKANQPNQTQPNPPTNQPTNRPTNQPLKWSSYNYNESTEPSKTNFCCSVRNGRIALSEWKLLKFKEKVHVDF